MRQYRTFLGGLEQQGKFIRNDGKRGMSALLNKLILLLNIAILVDIIVVFANIQLN